MTKKVNKDREFKSLCSKSRATGGKILIRGVVSEQMNSWMDVHGIDAEVTHNAHDDRELIIPDMPYSVRKAYQRWQEAVKAAELQDTPAPDCPYYVRTYLDEISAVKELRAAKAALKTIRKQSGGLYALDLVLVSNGPFTKTGLNSLVNTPIMSTVLQPLAGLILRAS